MPDRDTNLVPVAAIAGCGAISAAGAGISSLCSAMKSNAVGLRPVDRFASDRFQSSIVGAVPCGGPREEDDDPAWRLAVIAMREALTQARETLVAIPPARTGFVLSSTKANIEGLERLADGRPCSESARRHLQGDLLARDLAAEACAGGPVQCISLACISGLIAIQQASRMIARGDVDAVVVVGVDHLSAFVLGGFTALKSLDPSGCRPFDRDRCGLSVGEAGASIVLVRRDLAPAGSVVVRSCGCSNDANHLTGPSRDGSGLALAIRRALDAASLHSGDIDFVHAHGTGTAYNDAMESLALKTVFGDACPPVSASKGLLGHTLGAAGVIETILCALAFRENILPGTPRLATPAEGTPTSLVREPRPAANLRNILKLNTGFGGVNGAIVLGRE